MYLINKGGILVDNQKNTKDSILLDKFNKMDDGVMIDIYMTKDKELVLANNALINKK